jgi:hypothetical protein
MMDGTVSWLCGLKCAERIAVSMHSIRKHWHGPMLLVVTEDCRELGSRIAFDLGARVDVQQLVDVPRHSRLITKTRLPEWCPYDRAVYFDADTVVTGDFTPLFEPAVAITQFADWVSTGSKVRRRIGCFLDIPDCPPRIRAMVDAQHRRPHPAINTGVFAWHRGGSWVTEWQAIADVGSEYVPLGDEIAMQILHPGIEGIRVLDDRYNCSVLYGQHRADARVWHCHGKKHLRYEEGRRIWEPAFRAACDDNIGGLREWAGEYDPWIKTLLTGACTDGQAVHLD